MNDYRTPVPRMGRLASLRFVHDPPGFLLRGRSLARCRMHSSTDAGYAGYVGPWQFRLGGSIVTVLSDTVAAREVLSSERTRMFVGPRDRRGRAALEPLLGRLSPLLVEGPDHDRARSIVRGYRWAAAPDEDEIDATVRDALAITTLVASPTAAAAFETAVREAATPYGVTRRLVHVAREVDVVDALRRAAVRLAAEAVLGRRVGPGRHVERIERAAFGLAWASDCAALVVPSLRPWTPRWRKVAVYRAELLEALGLQHATEAVRDAAITTILGAVDSPAMVAARALFESCKPRWCGDPRPPRADIVARALERPTVPLLLREATGPIDAGVSFVAGDVIAVDTALAGLPFGYGRHACPGATLGRMLAEAALRVTERLQLVPVPSSLREGRRGLFYGPTNLILKYAPRV